MDVCERVTAVAVVAVEGFGIVRVLAMRAVGGFFDHGLGWVRVRLRDAVVY